MASLPQRTRSIRFNIIDKDSVNLALNSNFELIEDSCKEIIRHARFNMQTQKYHGKIKDVSSLDPTLVLTEGNYNEEGLKDGYFTIHYLNGKLEAKGSFKNNLYDGHWEIFYDDGKPKLIFEANGPDIKIMGAWDEKGKKIIDNGNGSYRVDFGLIYWKGKLLNGKPDGAWTALRAGNDNEMASEKYKNGTFVKGSGPAGNYTDVPKLTLVPADILPFVKGEILRASTVPCSVNGGGSVIKRNQTISAHYSMGSDSYTEELQRAIESYLRTIDISTYNNHFTINCEINDLGKLVNMTSFDSFNQNMADGLMSRIKRVPALNPPTIDGKPARQKFAITIQFNQGVYSFRYQFGQVEAK